jgi:hypothetical protein
MKTNTETPSRCKSVDLSIVGRCTPSRRGFGCLRLANSPIKPVQTEPASARTRGFSPSACSPANPLIPNPHALMPIVIRLMRSWRRQVIGLFLRTSSASRRGDRGAAAPPSRQCFGRMYLLLMLAAVRVELELRDCLVAE